MQNIIHRKIKLDMKYQLYTCTRHNEKLSNYQQQQFNELKFFDEFLQ